MDDIPEQDGRETERLLLTGLGRGLAQLGTGYGVLFRDADRYDEASAASLVADAFVPADWTLTVGVLVGLSS